jgi:hypothetical protein
VRTTVVLAAVAYLLAGSASALRAQSLEVMPFGGYRFGGDFFELAAEHRLDEDGAPAAGFVVNVPLSDGLQFEALVTHQSAQVTIPASAFAPRTRTRTTVDTVQGGGLQEFSGGRIRPFATGMLGLTRYAADGNSEVRLTVGAGGGVKLFPLSHLGLRLDGRVYTTFIDADMTFLACAPGRCAAALHVSTVWQAEFTAGVVVRFP